MPLTGDILNSHDFFLQSSVFKPFKGEFSVRHLAIGCSSGADNASNLASSFVGATRQRATGGLDRIEQSLVVISETSSNGFRCFVETYVIVTVAGLALRYEVTAVL